MSGVDDLVTWLRAQFDDDEAEATKAKRRTTTSRRMIRGQMVDVPMGTPPEWRRSVWPPDRVLAEVDAKRRILDRCEYELRAYVGSASQVALAHLVLKQFALPYADRPGYREEWRP